MEEELKVDGAALWERVVPTLSVAIAVLGTALSIFVGAHCLTRGLVGEEVFLKNYRKLFWEESLLYHKMKYAMESFEYNDVLVLGDSTALLDVDPLRMEERSHLNAYNLGTFGWLQADGHMEILRDYLQRHPRPRMILYLISPQELTDAYGRNDEFKDRFIWTYAPDLRRDKGYDRWPMEMRLREEFRTMIGRLAGMGARYERQEIGAGLNLQQLGEVLSQQRGFFGRKNPNPWPVAQVANLKVGAVPGQDLRRLARFCQEQGISLLIRVAPIPAQPSPPGAYLVAAWLEDLRREFPCVLIDSPVILQYPQDWFNDMMHLNAAGAERFTAIISDRVQGLLRSRPTASHG